jgi:hypothetical protein
MAMPPRDKKTPLEKMPMRQLVREVKKSLKNKLRQARASSKPSKDKG